MSYAENQLNETLNNWILVPFFPPLFDNAGSIHGALASLGKMTKKAERFGEFNIHLVAFGGLDLKH